MFRGKNNIEILIESGPDSQGRYSFTIRWMADYHPGHPDGEYRRDWRYQCYHTTLTQEEIDSASWGEWGKNKKRRRT